jgi:hypothetical protein
MNSRQSAWPSYKREILADISRQEGQEFTLFIVTLSSLQIHPLCCDSRFLVSHRIIFLSTRISRVGERFYGHNFGSIGRYSSDESWYSLFLLEGWQAMTFSRMDKWDLAKGKQEEKVGVGLGEEEATILPGQVMEMGDKEFDLITEGRMEPNPWRQKGDIPLRERVVILGKDTPAVEEEKDFNRFYCSNSKSSSRCETQNHDARETDYLLRMEEKHRMGRRGIVWQRGAALRGARARGELTSMPHLESSIDQTTRYQNIYGIWILVWWDDDDNDPAKETTQHFLRENRSYRCSLTEMNEGISFKRREGGRGRERGWWFYLILNPFQVLFLWHLIVPNCWATVTRLINEELDSCGWWCQLEAQWWNFFWS